MQIDIRVMELLASKLCHDLVSPVSAINNGVELIEDIGGPMVDEAMKLIGDSAQKASHRLRLYRLAYGRAGSEENVAARDMRHVAQRHLEGNKITLDWPEDQPSEAAAAQRGYLKTLLNLVLVGEESLAYGGTLTLRADENGGCAVESVGRNAHLSLPLQAALEGASAIEDLTPRSAQAYITGRFAASFDFRVTHDHPEADRLILRLFPKISETQPMVG